MRVWAGVGVLQNERISSPTLLSRGAAQRCADCCVSIETAPHASPCLDRRSPWQRRQLLSVLPPCAHPYTTRTTWHSFAREHTRALRAHVRHFSFFAFTSSPLCRKSLSDSRFGGRLSRKCFTAVKRRPRTLLRTAIARPTTAPPELTRGENHEKPPAKCRKVGATAS